MNVPGRSRTVDGLGRELQQKQARLEQEERNADTEQRLSKTAGDDRLDQAAADLLANRIDEAKYASVEAEVTRARAAHAANADRARRVSALLRQELSHLERQIAELPFEEAVSKIPALVDGHQTSADVFAKALVHAKRAGATLAKRRADLDAALAEAKRLRPEWRELDVDLPDEAAWPEELKELVALLEAGPRRTTAQAAERRRRRAEAEAAAAAQRVPAMVEHILFAGKSGHPDSLRELRDAFERLSVEEQAEALRRAAGSLDRVEREVREVFARPDCANPHDADRAVERARAAVERRIERLRELSLAPAAV